MLYQGQQSKPDFRMSVVESLKKQNVPYVITCYCPSVFPRWNIMNIEMCYQSTSLLKVTLQPTHCNTCAKGMKPESKERSELATIGSATKVGHNVLLASVLFTFQSSCFHKQFVTLVYTE